MALNKKIIKDSGLETNYHRITNITINPIYKQCVVSIEEYVSEDMRNKSKQAEDLKNKLSELSFKIENATDNKIKEALINKVNELTKDKSDLLETNFSTGIDKIVLDYIPEDTTYEGFYNEIKKLDKYKNAKLI